MTPYKANKGVNFKWALRSKAAKLLTCGLSINYYLNTAVTKNCKY